MCYRHRGKKNPISEGERDRDARGVCMRERELGFSDCRKFFVLCSLVVITFLLALPPSFYCFEFVTCAIFDREVIFSQVRLLFHHCSFSVCVYKLKVKRTPILCLFPIDMKI
ncbi:hypothetical protein Hanom_Chr07g00681211 [Helianthus anomalus]